MTKKIQVDETTFHVEVMGTPRRDSSALLLLHGFVGSSSDYDGVASSLAADRQVIRVDLPGHGQTTAPDHLEYFTFDRCVHGLLAVLDALDIRRCAVAGYSMGGRIALHLALTTRTPLSALILESTSYGILDAEQRKKRQDDDEVLANWIERHTIAEFVSRWEGHPLFQSQTALSSDIRARQRADRLKRSTRELALALRGMGVGNQRCLRDELSMITAPTLLVAGQLDEKYTEIATEMAALIDRAQLTIIPGVGHNVHLESPAQYTRIVSDFLAQIDQGQIQ